MADDKNVKAAFTESAMKDDATRKSAHLLSFQSGLIFTEDFKKGMLRVFTLILAQVIAEYGNKHDKLPDTDKGVEALVNEVGDRFLDSMGKVLTHEVMNEMKRLVKLANITQAVELARGEHL